MYKDVQVESIFYLGISLHRFNWKNKIKILNPKLLEAIFPKTSRDFAFNVTYKNECIQDNKIILCSKNVYLQGRIFFFLKVGIQSEGLEKKRGSGGSGFLKEGEVVLDKE